jgi:hypothetical protein
LLVYVDGAAIYIRVSSSAHHPPIVKKIYRDIVKGLAAPDMRKELADIGMEGVGGSPAKFAAARAKEPSN